MSSATIPTMSRLGDIRSTLRNRSIARSAECGRASPSALAPPPHDRAHHEQEHDRHCLTEHRDPGDVESGFPPDVGVFDLVDAHGTGTDAPAPTTTLVAGVVMPTPVAEAPSDRSHRDHGHAILLDVVAEHTLHRHRVVGALEGVVQVHVALHRIGSDNPGRTAEIRTSAKWPARGEGAGASAPPTSPTRLGHVRLDRTTRARGTDTGSVPRRAVAPWAAPDSIVDRDTHGHRPRPTPDIAYRV